MCRDFALSFVLPYPLPSELDSSSRASVLVYSRYTSASGGGQRLKHLPPRRCSSYTSIFISRAVPAMDDLRQRRSSLAATSNHSFYCCCPSVESGYNLQRPVECCGYSGLKTSIEPVATFRVTLRA